MLVWCYELPILSYFIWHSRPLTNASQPRSSLIIGPLILLFVSTSHSSHQFLHNVPLLLLHQTFPLSICLYGVPQSRKKKEKKEKKEKASPNAFPPPPPKLLSPMMSLPHQRHDSALSGWMSEYLPGAITKVSSELHPATTQNPQSAFIFTLHFVMPRPKKPGSAEPKKRSRNGCW